MELVMKKSGKTQAALLATMGAKTFYDAFAAQNTAEDMELYISTHFTPEKVAAEFEEAGAVFYIACIKDEAVGYIKTGIKTPQALAPEKCMELERLYLLQQHHGKGLGRQMLQHCISTAKTEDYDILWLGVWEYNPKAIGLYLQAGFQRFGEHTFQLGNDAQTDTLMKLVLNPDS